MDEFDLKNIFTDVANVREKQQAFHQMAHLYGMTNHLDEEKLFAGFNQREAESTTGFGNGVAIPHTIIAGIENPLVGITTFVDPAEWESLDRKPVYIAIALLMPEDNRSKEHLRILSKLARKLMDDEFTTALLENRHDAHDLFDLVTGTINFEAEK